MDIKPLYETQTINIINPTIETDKHLEKVGPKLKNYENIPNGISKVIHWEKIRQIFTIGMTFAISISMIILIILFAKVYSSSWVSYIIPSIIVTASSYKLLITLFERKYLLRSIKRYSEDLKIGITTTPAFIAKMYRALLKKQIRHNWFTFFVMFYGSIIVLLLWFFKDVSWWIFDFKSWIHSWFSNPDLMTKLFAAGLMLVLILHLVFLVQRKRRMLEIESYFGTQIMPQQDIDSFKTTENKMFRRLFIISLLVLLIIPIVIKIIRRLIGVGKK